MREPQEHGEPVRTLVRGLLHLVLVSGFLLGIVSLTLRRNKMLGAIAVTATVRFEFAWPFQRRRRCK